MLLSKNVFQLDVTQKHLIWMWLYALFPGFGHSLFFKPFVSQMVHKHNDHLALFLMCYN